MSRIMKISFSIFLISVILCLACVNVFAATATVTGTETESLDEYLLLYSSFDGTAEDKSGNGHNGTIVGNPGFVDGIAGQALEIKGQTNAGKSTAATIYVNYGDSSNIIPDTGDFSYSIFYRSTSTTPEWSIILGNKDYAKGTNRGFALVGYDDHGSWRTNIATGSKNLFLCGYTNPNIYDGEWHMLTTTHDRDGSMCSYVDGVFIASTNISGYPESVNAGFPLIVGADGKLQYSINNCELDELRIYNKALTASDVEQLYTSIIPAKMLTEIELNKILQNVQGVAPSVLFPQADIDNLVNMIDGALAQLDTASDEQCLALLDNCKAAYETFMQGKKPLASFHLITDVHITYGEDIFKKALQNMKSINADTNISLVIAGDNTNYGSEAQFEQFYNALYGNNPVSDDKTIVVMGNHDVRHPSNNSYWYSTPDKYDASTSYWETVKNLYMTYNERFMDDTDTVYFAKELGGYTFIALNTELDLKDAMYMSGTQLAWLEQTLADAYAKNPNKPIFIVNHQPLYDSHYGSSGWGTVFIDDLSEQESNERIKAIFAKYPNTIMLTGHSHNNFGTSVGVVRPYGAAVETPSLNMSSIDGGGFEVQIYESLIIFRAINYVTGEYMPQYDITIQTGEDNVSKIYQEAQKVIENSDKYCAESITDIEGLSDVLCSLISVSYADGTENFYKTAQHAEINTAAQNLKNALADVVLHDGEYACSTTCKFCNVENTVSDAVAHEGKFECSKTCKYGCDTLIADAKICVGAIPCLDSTCKWCGETVTPIAHNEVTDNAKDPTCTENGLTEGKHCSVCNEVLVAQNSIDALGHDFADATTEAPKTCKTCGATEGDKLPTPEEPEVPSEPEVPGADEGKDEQPKEELNFFQRIWLAIVNFFKKLFGIK